MTTEHYILAWRLFAFLVGGALATTILYFFIRGVAAVNNAAQVKRYIAEEMEAEEKARLKRQAERIGAFELIVDYDDDWPRFQAARTRLEDQFKWNKGDRR